MRGYEKLFKNDFCNAQFIPDAPPHPSTLKHKDDMRFFAVVSTSVDALWDDTPCWVWTGGRDRDGYGQFCCAGRNWRAHRWAWTRIVAAIPDHFVLDHLCRNRACVNPAHLDMVSIRENTARGLSLTNQNAAARACSRGHAFTPSNTYTYTRRDGGQRRYCRVCKNNYSVLAHAKSPCTSRKK